MLGIEKIRHFLTGWCPPLDHTRSCDVALWNVDENIQKPKEVVIGMKSLTKKMVLSVVAALFLALAAGQVWAAEPKINLPALLAKRVPILLEFGRGWCIPCKYMKPILEDMSTAYAGKALVMTVDMDANKDLVRDFKIRMMPTQVFLTPDGKEFFRNEGTLEREQIAQVFVKMGVQPPRQGAVPGQAPLAGTAQAPAYQGASR